MNAADFRRIALRLEGAEEGSHVGAPGVLPVHSAIFEISLSGSIQHGSHQAQA